MAPISIKIKCSNESAFSVSVDSEATTLQLKTEISKHFEGSNPTPVEQQRLIFAGKVLKDEESLTVYKVQEGNTIHLVRGNAPKATAPLSSPAAATTTPAANPLAPPASNPMSMFGAPGAMPNFGMPGAGMGGMPNMDSVVNNPMFLQMMSQMMSNPQMLDMMIQSNPQLAATITPEMRQHMQSPQFQQMMSNPEMLRMMLQMQGGMGGMGAGFNPANNMFGQPPAFNNPYASNPTPAATSPPTASPQAPMPGFNPALLQMMMGGAQQPGQPAQPPEVLYQTQLAQLQDMGFFNAAENIRALQMTGGNVEAAVEWLFSHPPGQL
ncbi:hypothetical protein HDV06_002471 [Boothiomyces sp. JEL0866]|nr:hypothetical protein HDV06_002471 [Boothiomyces sp. JEL0866]